MNNIGTKIALCFVSSLFLVSSLVWASSAKSDLRKARKERRIDERIQKLQQIPLRHPQTIEASKACVSLAKIAILQSDFATAERYLLQVTQKEFPGYDASEAHYHLAGIYLRKGLKDQARESLEWIVKQGPHVELYDAALSRLKTIYNQNGILSKTPERHDKEWKDAQGYYSVQVGSFKDRKNAEVLVKKLKRDYTVHMSKIFKDGNVYYRIRVGEYPTRQQATDIARLIQKTKGIPVVVVP